MTDAEKFFGRRDDSSNKRNIAAIEEKVVKSILKRFGIMPSLSFLKSQCEATTGSSDLSFIWFQQAYMSFPIWLAAKTVPWVRDMWGELREKFTRTPLFDAWISIDEIQPDGDGRPMGLVFTWPAFGECILHNYWRGGNIGCETVPGIRIVISMKSLGQTPLVIEPLSQFLQYLEWPEAVTLFGS